jgi:Tol biopolymer transport system component
MMDARQWELVKRLFQAALDRPDTERAAFVREACGSDAQIEREVVSLLTAHANAGRFAEHPPAAVRMSGGTIDPRPAERRRWQPRERVGPYEIQSFVAAGGMGQVYRARDTRLARTVAIKVLPETLAADPEFRSRFDREARTISQLEHPHICALYDVGEHEGAAYLVMPYLEGETLESRLRGSSGLPLAEALTIATQVASALDTAHRAGIVHRDLKPGNIMLTKAGAKLLDFGLARAGAWATPAAISQAPTVGGPATAEGTLLGTLQYMAPEQARGQAADHRADVFAFGAILYEMLVRRRAFAGATPIETLSAILEKDPPDLETNERQIPRALARIVERCLAKDPAVRFQSAGDLAFALGTLAGPSSASAVAPASNRRTARLAWVAAGVATVAAGIMALVSITPRGPAAAATPAMRLEVNTPPTTTPESVALSPDGRQIVFTATVDGRQTLHLRSLDNGTTRPLAGTEGARSPFWSPDSRSIAFIAGTQLKRLDVSSDVLQVLAANAHLSGSWSADGVILFTANRGAASGISRISAGGGEPVEVTTVTAEQTAHARATFLPDGNHFLYIANNGTRPGVYLSALDAVEPRFVVEAADVVYAPSGHLLFVRQGTLYAQPFDLTTLTLSGDPSQIAQQLSRDAGAFNLLAKILSISAGGVVAFRTGAAAAGNQLVWFDRSGKQLEQSSGPDTTQPDSPALSPDGKQIAFSREVDRNTDIWMREIARDVVSRFTVDAAVDLVPVWSPDGRRIAFASNRGRSGYNLYQKPTNSAGPEQLLLDIRLSGYPQDWAPDGRHLLYRVVDPKTGRDLWAIPLAGAKGDVRQAFPVANTPFEERDGQFSPDGRWVAYNSDASGRPEIYLQPFPQATGRWQVSTAGGAQPRWRRDGRELYYVAPDGAIVAATIAFGPAGAPDVGTPRALFGSDIVDSARNGATNGHSYAVTADGQRFLVNVTTGAAATAPITLLMNWTALLKE